MQAILYSYINCPHSLKTSFFLSEKSVAFTRVEVNMAQREHKTPAYLEINPLATVPAYEDEQGRIGDSLEIMRHVDASGSGPRLFPDDPAALQTVLNWVHRADVDFWDVSHHLYWQLIEEPPAGPNWQEVERLRTKGIGLLAELESILSQQDFVCGPTLSAADIALMPWVYGFKRFELLKINEFPHVLAWRDALAQRESFQQNYKQAGLPMQDFLATHEDPS